MKLKIYEHWSPRYFYDKFCQVLYDTINPGQPWFTRDSIRILDHYIKKTDIGIEYGSGRSTIWFAKKSKHFFSIEHDKKWQRIVTNLAAENHIENLVVRYVTKKNDYINSSKQYADNSFDYIVVDGLWRMECALVSLNKLKPGGLLIIDDCQRYIAYPTRSPEAVNAKQLRLTAKKLLKKLQNWRSIYTSDGVKDTSIFIKPLL